MKTSKTLKEEVIFKVNHMIGKAHGIVFHHFHDENRHPKGQGSITNEQFREIIIYLKNNFNLLSAVDWYNRSLNKELRQDDICITFDDNLLCQYDIALPILEEFGIKAFWFIYSTPLVGINEKLEVYRYFRSVYFANFTSFYKKFFEVIRKQDDSDETFIKINRIDTKSYLSAYPFHTEEDKIFRYTRDFILGQEKYFKIMDQMVSDYDIDFDEISKFLWIKPEDIQHLDNLGHIIGLHSHTHPTQLALLNYTQQLEEYERNRIILSSVIRSKIFSMSHPCNSYNDDTLKILRDMDIHLGFRSNMESGYFSNLEYPRLDHAFLIDKI